MMRNEFDFNSGIGESVVKHPQLVKLYMEYDVDFCCGGDRSVDDALKTDCGESAREVREKIKYMLTQSETEGDKRLDTLTNEALIDRIVETHHAYLKSELPVISSLLFKLLGVHGETHPELYLVHETFGALKVELESHLIKEEVKLFPRILSEDSEVKTLIDELEGEHDAAGDALHRLTEITNHFTLPQDACTTYALVYEKLKTLVADMYMHVHSENNILFKRL